MFLITCNTAAAGKKTSQTQTKTRRSYHATHESAAELFSFIFTAATAFNCKTAMSNSPCSEGKGKRRSEKRTKEKNGWRQPLPQTNFYLRRWSLLKLSLRRSLQSLQWSHRASTGWRH